MEEEDMSEEEDLPEEDTLSSTLSSSSSVLYSTTQSTTDTMTTVTMTTARNTADSKPRVDDIAEKGDAENVIGNNSEEGTCVLSSDWSESNERINEPRGLEDWNIPFVGL